jgi:hypothetical protein
VDTTITPFVVEYDGTFWNQPYPNPTPAAITDLAATLSGSAIRLDWSAVTEDTMGIPMAVDHYTIYRHSDPDFSPGPADSIGSTSGMSHSDPAPGLKDPGMNHYYLVKAVDESGRKSSDSNRVGEFDRQILNVKK